LRTNLENTIKHFENISIEEIIRYFELEERLCEETTLMGINDLEGLEKLPKLKKIAEELLTYNNAEFTPQFLTPENSLKLEQLIDNIKTSDQLTSVLSTTDGAKASEDVETLINESNEDKEEIIESLTNIQKAFVHIRELSDIKPLHIARKSLTPEKLEELENINNEISLIKQTMHEALVFHQNNLDNLDLIKQIIPTQNIGSTEALEIFYLYLKNIKKLNKPIVAYLFSKSNVKELTREFKKTYNYFNIENPEKDLTILSAIYDLFDFINSKNKGDRNFFDDVLKLIINSNDEHFMEEFKVLCTNVGSINERIREKGILKTLCIKLINSYIDLLTLEKITTDNNELVAYFQNEGVHIKPLTLNEKPGNALNLEYITNLHETSKELLKHSQDLEFIEEFIELHPEISESLNIDFTTNISDFDFLIVEKSDELINEIIEYKKIEKSLTNAFDNTPPDDYMQNIQTIEQLITAQMTYFLDKRIINYSQDNAGEVNTLKTILKNKQQFPLDLFENLKKAFPCILAGIRDYAEYIPLEKDLFDLIIIDEASQVSISQALPALIRGKQIIVLGDDKQFSNVKAGNASKVTNQQYKTRIREVFREEKIKGTDSKGWETKVKENFDIKNSILKFSRFIRNYQCQLQKHFRCYPEIISYSDRYFYDNTLQCMKIRGIPITEVIIIDIIEHDGKLDKAKNTNDLEAKHIIKIIKELKQTGFNNTIGIITPHREQVTLLFDMLNNLEEKDWLFETCKLKIMTFDTCQGEELG